MYSGIVEYTAGLPGLGMFLKHFLNGRVQDSGFTSDLIRSDVFFDFEINDFQLFIYGVYSADLINNKV